jgi:cytochrome c oxidase accessory protein FixG
VRELATFTAPVTAWVWIGIFTFTTYTLAGFMREQVCVYMCPWPRIQAALTDEYALNVTYRHDRGEPRVSLKKSETLRQQGSLAGDCIDCAQCVAVCPTGIDIRDGLQIDCIQCGLCIDACDSVMAKIGRPERLIAYDTDVNIRARQRGEKETFRLIRPRTVLYSAIIALVSGIMLFTLLTRHDSGINVIHDRNPQFVILADGATRNAYTIRILNKSLEERTFAVTVVGLHGAQVEIVGLRAKQGSDPVVAVGPDQTQEIRLLVTLHDRPPAASVPLVFTLTDLASGVTATAQDFFRSAP